MAAEQLDRPGSRPRDELAAALRSLHIETAARRRGAAAHVIYYLCARSAEAHDGIVVARVLHDHMEPLRHLARADVTGALR